MSSQAHCRQEATHEYGPNLLRAAVRDGRLPPGTRLPSSRALAADLGIARNTVADAYRQLVAEGWLTARTGAGTWVTGQDLSQALPAPGAAAALSRPARPPRVPQLCEALAGYLGRVRGVSTDPDRIIVCGGFITSGGYDRQVRHAFTTAIARLRAALAGLTPG